MGTVPLASAILKLFLKVKLIDVAFIENKRHAKNQIVAAKFFGAKPPGLKSLVADFQLSSIEPPPATMVR